MRDSLSLSYCGKLYVRFAIATDVLAAGVALGYAGEWEGLREYLKSSYRASELGQVRTFFQTEKTMRGFCQLKAVFLTPCLLLLLFLWNFVCVYLCDYVRVAIGGRDYARLHPMRSLRRSSGGV